MRETKFIEQNQAKWAHYEQQLRNTEVDPQELSEIFIQITDDLSYARTFYPNRSVRVYLNHMAQRVFNRISGRKRWNENRFLNFWTEDLPHAIWNSRKAMLLSLTVFVLAMIVGVVSSVADPEFVRTILGDEYVEMTLRNIENNDPMAVYKDSGAFGMTSRIALNNVFVAFRTAILGIFAGIGTIISLINNGVMLGAFQYFFIERGLFWDSFLTIWIHGTLEISAIIIAGGAGLVAGSGLLFPGTFTRTQAFRLSVVTGMKIFLGLIPVFLLAAFFEGFLTRYTQVPNALRGFFILLCAAFVVGYFVFYPWWLHRNGRFEAIKTDVDLPADRVQIIEFKHPKTSGEVVSDAFSLLKRHLRLFFVGAPLAAAITAGLHWWAGGLSSADVTQSNLYQTVYATRPSQALWPLVPVICLTIFAFLGLRIIDRQNPLDHKGPRGLWASFWVLCCLLLPSGIYYWFRIISESGSVWATFWLYLGFICFYISMIWAALTYFDTRNPFVAIGRIFTMTRFEQLALLGFFAFGTVMLSKWFLSSEVWSGFMDFFKWLLPTGTGYIHRYYLLATTFMSYYVLYATWILMVLIGAVQYFSAREERDATYLYDAIGEVGANRRIRGIAKEAV
jgi:uncharacterized membrane protein SpoIIM required for sporulation